MAVKKRPNWWILSILGFCLAIWGAGLFVVSKTAHVYATRSNAGFRHDFVEKARQRWVQVKRLAAPLAAPNGKES